MAVLRRPDLLDADASELLHHLLDRGIQASVREEEGDALYIEAHTDSIGEDELAAALSDYHPEAPRGEFVSPQMQRRRAAVAKLAAAAGLDDDELALLGLG